jgi:hypothetical protein
MSDDTLTVSSAPRFGRQPPEKAVRSSLHSPVQGTSSGGRVAVIVTGRRRSATFVATAPQGPGCVWSSDSFGATAARARLVHPPRHGATADPARREVGRCRVLLPPPPRGVTPRFLNPDDSALENPSESSLRVPTGVFLPTGRGRIRGPGGRDQAGDADMVGALPVHLAACRARGELHVLTQRPRCDQWRQVGSAHRHQHPVAQGAAGVRTDPPVSRRRTRSMSCSSGSVPRTKRA